MSTAPKRLLLLGGARVMVPSYLERARALGLRVVYVQNRAQFDASHLEGVEVAIVLDYLDLGRLTALACGLHGVSQLGAVVSLTEHGLLPAAHLNDSLRLGGTGLTTATLLKDKWRMRQRLAEMGLSPVSAALGRDRDDLSRFAAAHGLPIVVKPRSGTGSRGACLVAREEEFEATLPRVREDAGEDFLMEEFLDGPEVSVEAFSFHGRHLVLAVTEKVTRDLVEIGHATPARLDPEARAGIEAVTTGLLDAVGLRDGPSHTELKLTERGPLVVESHNRVGGDRIDELVLRAYGVDLLGMSLAWPMGLVEPLARAPEPLAAVAIRYLGAPPGRVVEVAGVERVRARREVFELHLGAEIGQQVAPLRSSMDRLGHLCVIAPETGAAIRLAEEQAALIRIVTEPEITGLGESGGPARAGPIPDPLTGSPHSELERRGR